MSGNSRKELMQALPVHGAVELLFHLPVLLTAGVYVLPTSAIWGWVLSLLLAYWAGALMAGTVSRAWLVIRILLAAAIGGCHAALQFRPLPAACIRWP